MSLFFWNNMNQNDSPQKSSDILARLRGLVDANGRRWKKVILLEAVGLAVAAPLGYLWAVFLLDNLWHLSLFGRVLASLGLLVGVGAAGAHLWQRWRSVQLSEDQVALAIERSTVGGVQNRLINALQISRGDKPADQQLSEAVVQENCDRLEQIKLEQAAQMRPAIVRMSIAGVLILIGLGFWLISPDQFSNAATRIFLPLARIDPLYRTLLEVDPGDVEGAGDITISIAIKGERPQNLILIKRVEGKRFTETIAVDPSAGPVVYTFRDVRQTIDYAVRGGDFTTPTYRITVPTHASLGRVRVTYQYPAYTNEPNRTVETRGDLEALRGARAQVTFVFDTPVDSASVLLDIGKPAPKMQALTRVSPREFSGEIALDGALSYRLETLQGDQPVETSKAYPIRTLKDQEPKMEITGIDRRSEFAIDSALTLNLTASDDFGLEQVGLFYRRAALDDTGSGGAARANLDEGWQSIEIWQGGQKRAFTQAKYNLALAALQAAEGDRIELALRARDTDPARKGVWTTGPIFEIQVGGDGALLQIQYERIIRSEKDLRKLVLAEQESLNYTIVWLRKLDGGGDLRWDDPKNIDALHAAVKSFRAEQGRLQKEAGRAAQAMLPLTGNLRIALGMLADTEMLRLQRIHDAVPVRETPKDKRAALADARATQERIIRSLEEILQQYQAFRSDWELSYMIPFTKMLAERQAKMRDQSRLTAAKGAGQNGLAAKSMHRRQLKMLDLCKLIQPAFTGLAARLELQEPEVASAFLAGSKMLASDALLKPVAQAADDAQAGRWSDASQHQAQAAEKLTAIYELLRKAQSDAAQKALAALKEKAKSDLEAQKELEKLTPGSTEAFLKDYPDKLKLEDLMRIRDIAGAKKRTDKNPGEEPDLKNTTLLEVDPKKIELKEDSGVRQDPYTLKLGKIAEKTPILKMYKASKENVVKPFVQEKFDDLVGKLLEETEELNKNYQSIKLSTNQNNNDPGEIGKVGGALNSTGAVTATGNKKPPTMESGGLSRTGRQGARAYGMVADDEGVNRRGRDKALDGKEQVADQKGTLKMKNSDDMQKDTATGVGGKKVESDDNHFSLHDAGKWKDEYAKRMEKPQKKQYIVERIGDKMDAKTAALLRDFTSKQEQIIERLNAIKKELRNLYLPTEHLDDLASQLESNLASLKEQPDPELFRQQVQTLDKLRAAMRVFRNASPGFQPSLPRERAIQGRVLDGPPTPGLPGYEDAVRQYYLKLAGQ
ncbi:MAG: hypothetical protein HYX68_12640 [Planctomycetes bacterium]|nr:hypothetical protein [Planctomycetota bacterium]